MSSLCFFNEEPSEESYLNLEEIFAFFRSATNRTLTVGKMSLLSVDLKKIKNKYTKFEKGQFSRCFEILTNIMPY